MHKYPEDFYNSQLSVCVVGYIRNEMKFDSLGTCVCVCVRVCVHVRASCVCMGEYVFRTSAGITMES